MPFTEMLMRFSGLCWSDGKDLIRSTLLCQLNMGSEDPEANILGLTEAFMHAYNSFERDSSHFLAGNYNFLQKLSFGEAWSNTWLQHLSRLIGEPRLLSSFGWEEEWSISHTWLCSGLTLDFSFRDHS